MKKVSIINKMASSLKDFIDKHDDDEIKSYGIIGIDLDTNQPGDLFINFKCSPHETLGIIEHMISILKQHKKEAQSILDEYYGNKKNKTSIKQTSKSEKQLEDLINSLPESLKEEIRELEQKMREAFEEGDVKKMIEVKKRMLKLRDTHLNNIDNEDFDKSEENDNDINDFK